MRVAGKLPFSHFLDATKLQSFSEYAKITHKLLNHGKQKKNNRQKMKEYLLILLQIFGRKSFYLSSAKYLIVRTICEV